MWFRKKKSSVIIDQQIKEQNTDFSKLFQEIGARNESEKVFKDLLRLLHPDNYVGEEEKQRIAEELFKEAQANQTDLEALQIIQQRAIKELSL